MYSLFKGKDILIIGGTGFIGRCLVNKFLSNNISVSILSLNKQVNFSSDKIVHFFCDVSDYKGLKKTFRDRRFDYVFNLSGYINHFPLLKGGEKVIQQHYIGVFNLIRLLYNANLKAFVQVGSSDEYGNAPSPQAEDLREAPFSPYSAAKTGITHLIQALARTEGFPGVCVRLFLVYGPGQDNKRFLPQIIEGCLSDREFPVSPGEQERDFCYIDDVADGLIKAAVTKEAYGEVINIASGRPVKIKDMVKKIVEIVGKGRPQFGALPYRTGESMSLYADIKKARELLGWEPKISLDDGLNMLVDWYKKQNVA